MGIIVENVAERHGISREAQDELVLESQWRVVCVIVEGRFAGQIVLVCPGRFRFSMLIAFAVPVCRRSFRRYRVCCWVKLKWPSLVVPS